MLQCIRTDVCHLLPAYYNKNAVCNVSYGRERQVVSMKTARQGLGRTGERLAMEQLVAHGYHVLACNVRCRYGEIDLVAEEGQDLVFIEVKTRRGTAFGLPEEAVTTTKQRKLVQLALYYLDQHGWGERSWRIDVVAVQLSATGKLEEIRIHPHAVRADYMAE